MTADFLVIGAGIAGLSFALRAARHGSVIVLTKGDAYESNTAWAQGGIASVLAPGERDPGDTEESHIGDTLDAGAGLCKEAAVRIIVQEGDAAIRDLLDYGVSFDREDGHFLLGKEGGHSHRRILHARDTTGREVARALIETARKTPNLTLLEDHFVIDLITSAKLGAVAAGEMALGRVKMAVRSAHGRDDGRAIMERQEAAGAQQRSAERLPNTAPER